MSDDLYELDTGYTPAARAHGNRMALGCAVLLIGGLALAINTAIVPASAPAQPSPVTTTAAPPAPPCIHETCGDRPARLRCIHGDIIPERCDVYAFEYEHHCTCDAWGTVATDGGAP